MKKINLELLESHTKQLIQDIIPIVEQDYIERLKVMNDPTERGIFCERFKALDDIKKVCHIAIKETNKMFGRTD